MMVKSRHYCNTSVLVLLFYFIISSLSKTGLGESNTTSPVNATDSANNAIEQSFTCHNLSSTYQRRLCIQTPGLLEAIKDAEKLARQECVDQLMYEKWNCSQFSVLRPNNVTKYATAETAYVYSLMSAALAHVVTRDCRNNGMNCECGKNATISGSGNKVHGCSSNWEFGAEMSAKFMDEKEKQGFVIGSRQRVNLQNNKVGRTVFLRVNHNGDVICKCIGFSASCSAESCRKGLTDFSLVAAELKNIYNQSCKVSVRSSALYPQNCDASTVSNTTLVHTVSSPDYCHKDISRGSLGVQGRLCDPSSATKSCNKLCCGRSHVQFTATVSKTCCSRIGCCTVICPPCNVTLTLYACR